jgi:nitrogen fixation/metabolism regulation signal transduction histidine kinase
MSEGPTGRRFRPVPDFVRTLIVYSISSIAITFYALRALQGAPRLPSPQERLLLVLLATIPLGLLAIFVLRMRGLLIDLRRRRYGARLRTRLVGLFLLAIVAASVPQGVVLLRIALAAQASSASQDVRAGLGAGLDLVLGYYADDARRLEFIARNDLPQLAAGRLPGQPERVLAILREREPRMDGLEVFSEGASVAFAGDPQARLGSTPSTAVGGPLASSTQGGIVRLRYLAPWGLHRNAVVLSLRMPDGFDSGAAALSRARAQAELTVPFSERWTRLLILLYGLFVLPLFMLAAILGIATADYIIEPILSLEDATRRVAQGDFGTRLLVKPGDETGRLIASFNRMLSEIEKYREGDLRQGKIDAWRDIAQRLAHELKNPLTPIRLAAERLLRVAKNDGAKALDLIEPSMLAIVAEVEAMDGLLQDFRSFASLPEPERDWADLRGLVDESVSVYRASYPEVRFDRDDVPEGLTLRVDRAQFKRALANLLTNAVEAMDGRGLVEISAELVKTAESRYCRLRITDDGPGVPADAMGRIFSPYFTTKPTGTGLGLAIVERIVADHGGSIHCESEEGSGASFYIDFPLDH